MTDILTAAQYQTLAKAEKSGRIFRASKERRTVDGIVFDSLKEANRWKTLRFAQIAGRISRLERQVPYALHVNGSKIGTYYADFEYLSETGELIVEDVKSSHTRKDPLFRWKSKHVEAEYGVKIREVI